MYYEGFENKKEYHREYYKKYYLINKEKIIKQTTKTKKELALKDPVYLIFCRAKGRAKKKNITFKIDKEYLNSIYPKNNMCPVLNIPFQLGFLSKIKKNKDYAPSLDRIIPEKGYVEGNLVIVSFVVNRVKNNVSIETLEKILDFYKKINEYKCL
jgi:hypothetical protein